MKRRCLLLGFAGGLGLAATQARAQGAKVVFGCAPVAECASVFVAAREGFFSKRRLDLSVTLIPAVSSTIPAALQAGSLQIGMACGQRG